MLDTGSRPIINSLESASPKPLKIFVATQPGGDYTYILDSLGPFIGFVRLWAECLIVRPCTITIVALTFAKYSVKLAFPECDPPDESVRMLAAVCICKNFN